MALTARRALLALSAATLAVALLAVLMAWIALRADWDVPEPAALTGPTELLDRDGRVLVRFTAEVDRRVVTLEEVAPVLVDAVIAAEDARFHEHEGVDPLSLLRAVVTNVRTGGISQGGSTLTQQYVKNAFVGDDRTLLRKVREAVIAVQLERTTSKHEILERYLNTVPFGEGAYGVEAAARTYFGVGADELDAAQAATLAQLLPAPSLRNPRVDPEGATTRRDLLLARMGELGVLEQDAVRAAQDEPLEVRERRRPPTPAPAFVGYVRRQLDHAYGPDAVLTGALRVTTTFDRDAQEALDRAIERVLPREAAGEVEVAAVALDPRDGSVLAIHGGRDLQLGDLDLATMTRRQNGSAFKPFVYAAALTDGLVTPDSARPSPGSVTISRCVDHDGPSFTVRGGPGGSRSVHEAMVRSVNTTFQLLGCELGGPRIVEEARRLGVANEVGPEPAVALGGSSFGASVLDMASAYGTFANDGVLCPARSITAIEGLDGTELDPPAEVVVTPGLPREARRPPDELLADREERWAERDGGGCLGVLDPRVARQVNATLQDVVTRGTGRAADIGRPQAGKTGTTTDVKDAWFVGYTPELVLAVWVGDPGRDGEVTPLRDVAGIGEVYGGTLPAEIWAAAAEAILADVEGAPFPTVQELDAEDRTSGPVVAPSRPLPRDGDGTAPSRRDDANGGDPEPPAPGPGDDEDATPPPEDGPDDDAAPPDDEDGDGQRCLLLFEC